jgi:hypothetical protein
MLYFYAIIIVGVTNMHHYVYIFRVPGQSQKPRACSYTYIRTPYPPLALAPPSIQPYLSGFVGVLRAMLLLLLCFYTDISSRYCIKWRISGQFWFCDHKQKRDASNQLTATTHNVIS